MKSKKLISVVLTLAMVLGLLPAVALSVYADGNLDSGFQLCDPQDANNNVIAKWNSNKSELIISGKGQIDRDKWFDMIRLSGSTPLGFYSWGKNAEHSFNIKFESESASDSIKLPKDSSSLFAGFSNEIDFGTDGVDTSEVFDMSDMFAYTKSFNSPVNFDTTDVGNMASMFDNAKSFNQPVNFYTRYVRDMSQMFSFAESFNQPVNFDTTDVGNMASMFNNAKSFNQPVNFDTRHVAVMSYMFFAANSFNQNIDFDISACNKIKYMFANSGINNKSIILRNSEKKRYTNGINAFENIKPSYLEFIRLIGDELDGKEHPVMISGFSGDYRVEKDGKFVAEHKADEAYAFDDSAHYKVYLKPEDENEENDEEENGEEKIKTYFSDEWEYYNDDNLEKYYDGKPFVFEDLKLYAITGDNKDVAGKVIYDKNKFANAINIGEHKIEFKFVPDDKKYAEIKKEITLTIKENPLKSSLQ